MASERSLTVGGQAVRIMEGGDNPAAPPVVFFAGIGGLPRWVPFLESLAQTRRVVVPSLPGFPGAEEFRHLDNLLDWIVHVVKRWKRLIPRPST